MYISSNLFSSALFVIYLFWLKNANSRSLKWSTSYLIVRYISLPLFIFTNSIQRGTQCSSQRPDKQQLLLLFFQFYLFLIDDVLFLWFPPLLLPFLGSHTFLGVAATVICGKCFYTIKLPNMVLVHVQCKHIVLSNFLFD